MIHFTFTEAARLANAPPPACDGTFTGIAHDTRVLQPGNLHVAIQGERIDGHDLVEKARMMGASATLVNHPVDSDLPQLVVMDTIAALGKITAGWRARFHPAVFAITGSNGKTTVKNMLKCILEAATAPDPDAVLATPGNLNNTLGLPLALAGLGEQHKYVVLEMGMNRFGEIGWLAQIAKPSVAVITNAAASHLEGVGDLAGVARAKGEIFSELLPDGTAILNVDDDWHDYWHTLSKPYKRLTFGLEHPADVTAIPTGRPDTVIKTPAGDIPVELSLGGRHNLQNALAATAAALAAGIAPAHIQQGLACVREEKGRLQIHALSQGPRVIDDSYNANPFSLKAALAFLADFPAPRVLILGDMKELGTTEISLHREAGRQIQAAGVNHLFTCGTLAGHAAETFGEGARHFSTQAELLSVLPAFLEKNMTLLIKGSRSMQMEHVVQTVLETCGEPSACPSRPQ